jgi:UDP-N-acetylmuramoylalanine--D-glutamate ligase
MADDLMTAPVPQLPVPESPVPESTASLAGRRVLVAGLGITGQSAADLLAASGADVIAVDSRDDEERRHTAALLEKAGVTVRLGPDELGTGKLGPGATVPAGTELVVTSPGLRPDTPLLAGAVAAGIEVIGDVELAWRLRPVLADGTRQPWLAITGTNGKTTTVRMLAAMLAAAGHRSLAAGNVGTPILSAVTEAQPYEVLAVELSSFQLYWSSTVTPLAAALLNVEAHHLDWHDDIESYAAAKSRIFASGTIAICNAEDARSASIGAAASQVSRLVSFRLGEPGPGELGVADGWLTDRAFGGDAGVRLAPASAVRPPAPHNIADALAAAALARAYGDPPEAIAAGLHAFQPEPHRITQVGSLDGVVYVDDSKASNPAAARASLASFPSIVWIAGGLFRGTDADLDALVSGALPRLRGAVLLGADRQRFREALARHAPDVPVTEVTATDTGVMDLVVAEAARVARPGDTVLLAPAAQSFDLFRDYPARCDAFATAVSRLAAAR